MKRFSNILYICDSDMQSSMSLIQAANLAKANQARLTIVSYLNHLDRLLHSQLNLKNILNDLLTNRKNQLKQYVDSNIQGLDYEIKIFHGNAFIEIIQEVLNYKRDLLIKPIEEPQGLNKLFFDSLDMKLIRKCPCPIWMLKPKKNLEFHDIVVALDYDPESEEVDTLNNQLLTMAHSIAESNQSQLHVVHAWQLPFENLLRSSRTQNSKSEVDEMVLQERQDRSLWLKGLISSIDNESVDLKVHLIEGNAKQVISALINDLKADLTVMGTIGRTGIPGYIIGNTAETILNNIDCSVLAVKPKSFVCPIKLD